MRRSERGSPTSGTFSSRHHRASAAAISNPLGAATVVEKRNTGEVASSKPTPGHALRLRSESAQAANPMKSRQSTDEATRMA